MVGYPNKLFVNAEYNQSSFAYVGVLTTQQRGDSVDDAPLLEIICLEIWLWDFEFVLVLVVFVFGIYLNRLKILIICPWAFTN